MSYTKSHSGIMSFPFSVKTTTAQTTQKKNKSGHCAGQKFQRYGLESGTGRVRTQFISS